MKNTLKLIGVARLIGVTRGTLYAMIADGRFPVKPIPNTKPRLWTPEKVEKWRRGEYDARIDETQEEVSTAAV